MCPSDASSNQDPIEDVNCELNQCQPYNYPPGVKDSESAFETTCTNGSTRLNAGDTCYVDCGEGFEKTGTGAVYCKDDASADEHPVVDMTCKQICDCADNCPHNQYCKLDGEDLGNCESCNLVDCEGDVNEDEDECCSRSRLVFIPKGQGLCNNDLNGMAPNYSRNGMDEEGCKDACRETDDCIGISLSLGGRCALWMNVDQLTESHPVFGPGHPGVNWRKGDCLSHSDNQESWSCHIFAGICEYDGDDDSSSSSGERGSHSSSGEKGYGRDSGEFGGCEELALAMGAITNAYEVLKDDADFVKEMFEQCVMGELTDNQVCTDYIGWFDSEGKDCDYYEKYEMCQYDYIHIFENDDGYDGYDACCACGGGEITERRALYDAGCADVATADEELICLRQQNELYKHMLLEYEQRT
eukprot:UN30042